MSIVLIVVAVLGALFMMWRMRTSSGEQVQIQCPSCLSVNKLTGPICPHCNEQEEILVRQDLKAGVAGTMQILLYHCKCNSRVILCDLKCFACGARISGDRRTELRPIEDPGVPERTPVRLAQALEKRSTESKTHRAVEVVAH